MKDCWSRLECLAWFLNFKWQVWWCIFDKGTNVLQAYQITSLAEILGRFHSQNNPVWNFGTNPSHHTFEYCMCTSKACTIQIEQCWGQQLIFVEWKGTFRSEWLKWLDQSKWTTFTGGLKYSGRTKPKWSVSFHREFLHQLSGLNQIIFDARSWNSEESFPTQESIKKSWRKQTL